MDFLYKKRASRLSKNYTCRKTTNCSFVDKTRGRKSKEKFGGAPLCTGELTFWSKKNMTKKARNEKFGNGVPRTFPGSFLAPSFTKSSKL